MKIKNLKLEIIVASIFILFLIFSALVSLNVFSVLDYRTTVAFQSFFPESLTTPFSIFSILGSFEVMVLALLLILLFFTKIKKIYLFAFFVLVGLIEIAGKTFIEHVSPPIELLRTNISFGFPSGKVIPHEIFYSYPSGHTARTAFISTVLIFAIWRSPMKKEFKYIFAFCILIFDLIMFVSRIYLGEHWLTDVIGGALLGFSLCFIAYYFTSLEK